MVSEQSLLRVVKAGVVGFLGVLVLAFVPPITSALQYSETALLGYVLAMFAFVLAAVVPLMWLNRD